MINGQYIENTFQSLTVISLKFMKNKIKKAKFFILFTNKNIFPSSKFVSLTISKQNSIEKLLQILGNFLFYFPHSVKWSEILSDILEGYHSPESFIYNICIYNITLMGKFFGDICIK